MATPNVTPSSALDSVNTLLATYKDQFIASDNPLVNQQLQMLLGELYKTQKNVGALATPQVVDISNLTTADLITMLMTENRKTSALVAGSTIAQIKANQKNIKANNDKLLTKLKEAQDASDDAQKLSDGMGIFKWVMLAISVILLVVSVIATVCTFGAAAPTIVAASVVLAASVALTIATSVPVDDQQNSAMDLATQKLSQAIADLAKKDMIDSLKGQHQDWDALSDDQQQAIIDEATATGTYSAMSIMISLQIIIAIGMVVLTAGAASGCAASYTVNAVANDVGTGIRATVTAAVEAAKTAIENNIHAITGAVKNIQMVGQLTQDVGKIANAAVAIDAADLTQTASIANADVSLMRAYSAFLKKNNDQLIELVQELYSDINQSYTLVAAILKADHQSHLQLQRATEGSFLA